ncbi:MAG: TlpA family protein disulfide reductase [Gemmatimonadaceae bacterium]|jgi:thiol-disulfide isomerase/thioredoxin|nr:TlpA family protein disulfide reductase [Gemmatimonadaceae bacterium]
MDLSLRMRAVVSVLAIAVAAPVFAQDSGIAIGAKAPDATLETLEGAPATLSQYVGKGPVLLEFWATWCGNCKQMEPAMKAAHAKYGRQVQFVTIAVSVNQPVARAKAYRVKYGIPGVMLYDRKGDAGAAYDAPATSYVVVIDKGGVVRYTGVGGTQDLDAAIKRAL